jgi:hypothetical protein
VIFLCNYYSYFYHLIAQLWQFFLTLNRINKFVDLRIHYWLLVSVLPEFDQYLAICSFSASVITSKESGLGTNSLAKSWVSSFSIATDYGLDYQMIRVQFPVGAGNFSLQHHVQTSSRTHPASYPMGTRSSFPGSKAAGAWKLTTHCHLVSRSKNVCSYTSTPPVHLHGEVHS